MTRHGEPMETMLLAWTVWRKPAAPPAASAAPATTAKPTARPASIAIRRRQRDQQDCSTARARPPPTSASVILTAKPSPASAPAAAAQQAAWRTGRPATRRTNTATAATPKKMAWLSTCWPATSTWSSNGLAVHNRAARACRARSPRNSRCRISPVPANAARLSTDSTSTVSRAEVPPMNEASACPAVATVP